MLLYGGLALCALAVGAMVYRYDLYDREPWWLLALSVLLGMGAMYLAGRAQVFWLERGGVEALLDHQYIALLAGTHEELGKLLVVLLIALVFRRWFNDPMDGLIYGSFAGLGAAIDESLAVVSNLEPGSALPAQEPVRLLGHLIMGGIGGAGLGFMRARVWWWWIAASATFLLATLIHYLWDVIAVPANDEGVMTRVRTWQAIALMLFGLVIYGGCVIIGSAWSRRLLAPDDPRRLTRLRLPRREPPPGPNA